MTLNRRIFMMSVGIGGFAAAGLGGTDTLTASLDGLGTVLAPPAAAANEALMKPGPLGDNIVGSPDAPITIIEYASLTCPHCRDFHVNTYPELKKKYIDTGKVKLIFREFPLNSPDLAAYMLTRCTDKSKFFPLVDLLFKKQSQWAQPGIWDKELFKIAKFAGFTKESFDACLRNKKVALGVRAVRETGEKFNVTSTPTFFFNGEIMRGNPKIAEFDKRIGALSKK